jgi:hypothetical protein
MLTAWKYRMRVYWRLYRRRFTVFNARVREKPWTPILEDHFWLAFCAVVILLLPFHTAEEMFAKVIFPATRLAMMGWLVVVPVSLLYAWIVKWRRADHE